MTTVKVQTQKGNLSGKDYWCIKIYGIPELIEAGILEPIILHMPDFQYGTLKNYNIDIEKLLKETIANELSCM